MKNEKFYLCCYIYIYIYYKLSRDALGNPSIISSLLFMNENIITNFLVYLQKESFYKETH